MIAEGSWPVALDRHEWTLLSQVKKFWKCAVGKMYKSSVTWMCPAMASLQWGWICRTNEFIQRQEEYSSKYDMEENLPPRNEEWRILQERQRPPTHRHVAFMNILVFLYILKLQINIKQHLCLKEAFDWFHYTDLCQIEMLTGLMLFFAKSALIFPSQKGSWQVDKIQMYLWRKRNKLILGAYFCW